MSQIFHRSTNIISRAMVYGAAIIAGAAIWIGEFASASWISGKGVAKEQPIQFSHAQHVGGDGIDCRYCHTSVEESWYAGIPPTKTCMNCHSQLWMNSPYLEPVRASYRTGQSIQWTRVYDLPDFVYFNHSIHINKGVGCVTCHGRVDEMPLIVQEPPLTMGWCLECHRNPERYVQPRETVFKPDYQRPSDQVSLGRRLIAEYQIQRLTSCSTCHR